MFLDRICVFFFSIYLSFCLSISTYSCLGSFFFFLSLFSAELSCLIAFELCFASSIQITTLSLNMFTSFFSQIPFQMIHHFIHSTFSFATFFSLPFSLSLSLSLYIYIYIYIYIYMHLHVCVKTNIYTYKRETCFISYGKIKAS